MTILEDFENLHELESMLSAQRTEISRLKTSNELLEQRIYRARVIKHVAPNGVAISVSRSQLEVKEAFDGRTIPLDESAACRSAHLYINAHQPKRDLWLVRCTDSPDGLFFGRREERVLGKNGDWSHQTAVEAALLWLIEGIYAVR
jgi:hypothetical protein